ncbi:hypothetical protein CKO28_22810 [Rhodovibrio sodomensis]|uniref:Tc1-like transposase DDE domain-containing protein n=1 Tax=Rhodovibrio sodomensis TaxID=1088 RepID=A0ABS1DLG7_9PROT|nr:hypothetical protein [Rhodovibrio sodomensis]
MARMYGRSARGDRCRAPVPRGHSKTTTFVGALRLSGMTAPMTLDSAMTGVAFLAYVEQVLVPALRPGDIVVMDNLPAHKPPAIRATIERTGAELHFLPSYSPDFKSRWLSRRSKPSSKRRRRGPLPASGTPSATPSIRHPGRLPGLLHRSGL